jgi:hypothetical protein
MIDQYAIGRIPADHLDKLADSVVTNRKHYVLLW